MSYQPFHLPYPDQMQHQGWRPVGIYADRYLSQDALRSIGIDCEMQSVFLQYRESTRSSWQLRALFKYINPQADLIPLMQALGFSAQS